ncbi:MAG TPA: c-type cytochrome [Methylomirabilota bacterium]|nr:c-type cytochrome [Methylomirabilota bacterium]
MAYRMERLIVVGLVALGGLVLALSESTAAPRETRALVDRGRYLVKIAGCNDCHTPRYTETGGAVPEAEWLTGDRLGWRGPWGTTYAINLRLHMNGMTEQQWITAARTVRARPPMPWFALRDMSDEDLRAIYRFVRSLGPRGGPAPAYVPPDRTPPAPYVQFPAPPK